MLTWKIYKSGYKWVVEEFIDLNSPFIAESQGSFVYEFKPYSTHI